MSVAGPFLSWVTSEIAAVSILSDADILYVVNEGESKSVTIAQLASKFGVGSGVTSLNEQTGALSLTSVDGTVDITTESDGSINLEAVGGVTSLNGGTGDLSLTSASRTITFTVSGTNISADAVSDPIAALRSRKSIASFSMNSDGTQAGFASPNNSYNGKMVCWAPGNSDLTDIVIAHPGSSFPLSEADNFTPFTATGQIEYPAGVFWPVYSNGQRSLTVNNGRTITEFDPCSSLVIPAGAQYWVHTWLLWPTPGSFYGNSFGSVISGSVLRTGVNLPDETGQTPTSGTQGGCYVPILYGTVKSPVVLGILGTSHDRGANDIPDPNSGGAIAWARAMRGLIPVTTFSKVGVSATQYLVRPDGANILFRNRITHQLLDMASNDVFTGETLATLQSNVVRVIAPFLARGIKVYTSTVTPRSTSTDVWMTIANQTPSNGPAEAIRVLYNAWLRANWRALGLSGLFDFGRAMDPTDLGVYAVDLGAQATTNNALPIQRAWCTMSSGVWSAGHGSVASMPLAFGAVSGALFAPNSQVNTIVRNCPGDTTGAGAVVVGNTDGTGKITSWTVVAGGANYQFPPMIAPIARPTIDGTHFSGGQYDKVIDMLQISPASFN